MRKTCLCISAMCCLLLSCSEEEKSCREIGTECDADDASCQELPVCFEELVCPEVPLCQCPVIEQFECVDTIVNRCMSTACPIGQLCFGEDAVTLYYDSPRSAQVFYNSENNAEVSLSAEGNECVEIITDSIVTGEGGYVDIKLKAKKFDCEDGQKVKVCLANEPENCAEIAVSILTDSSIDKNKNLMIDEFETNTDKDKYPEGGYKSGDCSSFCHDDSDCEDFCDSAIGFRCSTRCTSDDQCMKYQDGEGNWVSMICRKDGRCAYPEFKYRYSIAKAGTNVVIGGHPVNQNDSCTIDWGDGNVELIPAATNNDLSHTYKDSGKYDVTIKGEYMDWRAGCSVGAGIDLDDVMQFGPIGLGYMGNYDKIDEGSFTNCHNFNMMSAPDIPDSTKLTNMSSMFGGNVDNTTAKFNQNAITRWDTSNVTMMYHTFINSGSGDPPTHRGFNHDIGRWNVSKVKSMQGMFLGAIDFNVNINCWDVSQVRYNASMFFGASKFDKKNKSDLKFVSIRDD